MQPAYGTVHTVLLVASAAATSLLAAAGWRHRGTPGARPFAGLMVATTVWTLGYAVGLTVHPGGRLLWERVQWLGIVAVPVAFLGFALEYVGRGERLRAAVGATAVPSLAMLALVWTNPAHRLVWRAQDVYRVGGIEPVGQVFGPAYWAFLVYAYALIAVGSYLLVRVAITSEYLYLDQSLLLGVGVVVPLVANLLSVLGQTPLPGIDLTPYAFTVTGIAFGNALFRYRLFERVPASWRLGRESVVGHMEDGVLVVDDEGVVVYCNDEAAAILDVDPSAAVGDPLAAVADAPLLEGGAGDGGPPLEAAATTARDGQGQRQDQGQGPPELERDGRTYEVRVSPVVDRHDRQLGWTVVLADVTEARRREATLARQRDELLLVTRLNQVIREVNAALVAAGTRTAVLEGAAARLADSPLYDAAWAVEGSLVDAVAVVEDDVETAVSPGRTGAGQADGGPVVEGTLAAGRRALAPRDDDDFAGAGAGDAVLGPGPTATGSDGADGPESGLDVAPPDDAVTETGTETGTGTDGPATPEAAGGPPAEEASTRGRWTTIPVVHGRTVYGTLVLFSVRDDAYDDRELAVLDDLGRQVGHAANAAEQEQLLVADAVTELELVARGEEPLAAASREAGVELTVEGVVPADGTAVLAYCGVDGAAAAVAALSEADGVASARAIDDATVECRLVEGSLAVPLRESGARIVDLAAADGTTTAVAQVARDADVRALVDRVQESVPAADLQAKRRRDGPGAAPDAAPETPDLPAELTDRQRETLETAYRAGYFEWPRESTAEEVADAMGVSAPTLHNHLRKAENEVLGELLEEE